MLKLKKITLSGFRGILTKQELGLTASGNNPCSLVIYGLNSSGKTSFVDALEWFLSSSNEIEWLKRENAGSHAYPHQEAQQDGTYVEIDFSDSSLGTLRKTYNPRRVTMPGLSSEEKFNNLYQSFTIRPYLRYLEIIDFVFNRTGVEKYQKLANWMGFEEELAFQEKIALGIIPQLREAEKKFITQKELIETDIKNLLENQNTDEKSLISGCNILLKQIGHDELKSIKELTGLIKELDKKRIDGNTSKLALLTKVQINLQTTKLDQNIFTLLSDLEKKINEFNQKKELADKIEYVNLYEKAYEILEKQNGENVTCPVCNTAWKRTKLIEHIKKELELLKEVKESHDQIVVNAGQTKASLENEVESLKSVLASLDSLGEIKVDLKHPHLSNYKTATDDVLKSLGKSIFERDIKTKDFSELQKQAIDELVEINKLIEKEKEKLEPSKTELIFSEVTEKLRTLNTKITDLNEITSKQNFFSTEMSKFLAVNDELSKLIQDSITKRFKDISASIEKYFKILRKDKDIKGIEILLNLEKARAVGRSAEIQLSYYDLVVKPAYKVLSESLLNSLGLAVYFTCVKQFNTQSKFIVLDDVMNSLDVGHRDTLLDLIEQEFSDYQMILFTHDLHWFERIQRRFPNWLHKKIKNWSYETGPKIDKSSTSLDEINELLEDSTKASDAGRELGVYIEGIMNELCEQLQVEVRYRYFKHDLPSLEELFIALHKRLKDKLAKNPVTGLVQNAQKYEPLIRNATSHARQNYTSSIIPDEVKRAVEEWIKLEQALWCSSCNKFVAYNVGKDKIECECGGLKLDKIN